MARASSQTPGKKTQPASTAGSPSRREGLVVVYGQRNQQYTFNKSTRFDTTKVLNHQVGYRPKVSDFEKTRPNVVLNGLGGTSPRFDYYSSRRKHGDLPSSLSYSTGQQPTRKGHRSFLQQPNKSYSFGVSRANMQKIYVDSILEKKAVKEISNVGPGAHDLSTSWVMPKDTLRDKTTPQYSFPRATAPGKDFFMRKMGELGQLPGPGQYGGRTSCSTVDELASVVQSANSGKRNVSVHQSLNETVLNQTMSSIGFKSQFSTVQSLSQPL